MILYHGSNIEISEIILTKGRHGKDFGRGFYLSADYRQAVRMAENVVRREGAGVPCVTRFEFDESRTCNLTIKRFDGYTEEWARFVLDNRRNYTDRQSHPYDIVIGPIANDAVGVQIRLLSRGFITFDKFIENLKFTTPTVQYFFGTEQAVKLLKKL